MTSNDPSAPGNRPNRRRALGRGPGAAPPTTPPDEPPATPEGGTAVPAEPGPPLAPPAEGAGAGTPGRVLPPVGPGVRPAQRTSAPVPGPSEGGPGVRQAGRPAPSGPPRAQEAADGPEGAAGPPPGPVAPPSAGTGGTVRPAAERSEPDGSPVGSTPAPDDLDARPDRGTAARPVPGAPVRAEPDGTPASEPDARAVGTGTAGASAEPDPVPRGLGAEPPVGAVGLSGASASGVLAPGTEAVSPGAGASGSGAGTVEPGAGTLEQGAGAAGPKTRAAGSRTGALGTGTGPEGGVSGGEEGDGRFTVRLVDPEKDEVKVDGLTVATQSYQFFSLNKPAGVVSTMEDPEGRQCLGDYVTNRETRLFHVGRLDTETEGVILLTNHGELAHRLTHPRYGVRKTYLAHIVGPIPRDLGKRLKDGIQLEDGYARADHFRVVEQTGKNYLVEVTLHEGRKHIVRRMLAEAGFPVDKLVRTAFGPITLGDQKSGWLRRLSNTEVGMLMQEVDL
ncbi:hypothetical protein SGRIM128S_03736 [Streptomyces griseomycini]